MNFSFTDDQLMIRDAAENFLADASDSAAVRRAGEQGCDASVWARIGAELGWCGVPVAEAHGGRISLQNREGGGLWVSLSLPAR